MAQFDLFRNPRKTDFPLLLDVQADLLSELATRVVVPLAPKKAWQAFQLTRLNPCVSFQRADFVLVFQELAAIPRSALGSRVGSLASQRAELIAALDLLFTGV